jgi:phenylpyruvate tautomerase PptA (4-oxalocrotonate tautomerase family)
LIFGHGGFESMPTYTCTAAVGLLSPDQKQAIAAAVTGAHSQITGAPASFAQVLFHDVAEGDHFIGGKALRHDHVFIEGRIRAGRSVVDRTTLLERLIEDVAAATALPSFSVWVYLHELPPAAMAEFGHILPEPGDEPEWADALPEHERERLEAIDAGRHGK